MKKAIIFDLDGTLWDSRIGVRIAWNETFEKYSGIKNRYTDEDIGSVMGLTMKDISHALFSNFGDKENMVAKEAYEHENFYLSKHPSILFEGIEETLRILSEKYELYIVSNCQSGYIEAFYSSMKLDKYFKDQQCYGDNSLPKGENITLIMKRNNVDKAIYVGDTLGDEKATRMAGIPFVYASYGFGQAEKPDGNIKSFSELIDVAERMLG